MKAETYLSWSEEETIKIGEKVASSLKGDEVVFLQGELGCGKTVFVKGIAKGLGFKKIDFVTSPSYVLLNIYDAKYPIYHFDLYRLERSRDIAGLDWEDYIGKGIVVVEWSEKIEFKLRQKILLIKFFMEDEVRKITIKTIKG
ncbi:MAG: tRNA (adenosine(37)-N6)-threonylcarbamoyltransferase complex ATPase subunit type 1 TsaE [Acidobacteriota bacterium]